MIQATSHEKASALTARCAGMNKFIGRAYLFTGLHLGSSIGTAYALGRHEYFSQKPLLCFGVGIGASLVGLIGAKLLRPQLHENVNKDGEVEYSTSNSFYRLTLYGLSSVGLGAIVAPLLSQTNDQIILTALALTGLSFGTTSLLAYRMSRTQAYSWKSTLKGCTLSMFALSLVGGLVRWINGPNAFSDQLFKAENFLGFLAFGLYMVIDTHNAIERYENKDPDHLDASVEFSLNAINIFIRIIQFLNGDDNSSRKRRNN